LFFAGRLISVESRHGVDTEPQKSPNRPR